MGNHVAYRCINFEQFKQMSFTDLLTMLDAYLETNTTIDTDTVLLVLEVIEQRVGNEPSSTLDEAWKKIKKEYLK